MKISKLAAAAAILGAAAPAHADPGHVADIAGHSHWIALAAASAAAAIGVFVFGKKRSAAKEAEDGEAAEADAVDSDTQAKA
ncbi:DUF6732 family protein [Oricola cellulosilytica]|uniref:LPXTG cell wall anchor domain-containing protein n=1 Tax=Oricola cellulosilytica TaxID=1429082 RepID=A0A4R0PF50_9HYPH|nr:DUF6732 family protein [Oricola cellulosilytica]TCD15015.1 hypothetical protein E0D97_05560 [Oricola cellulosilytica]